MPKLFITGGAGFLGSAILSKLVNAGWDVIAAKRTTTQMHRCEAFQDSVKWVNTDEDYTDKVIAFKPDIIIHAAWSGVSVKDRSDWTQQLQNFSLFKDLVTIAQHSEVKKFIVLGSQAEYGSVDTKMTESHPATGKDAYASCKTAMQKLLEAFCTQQSCNWYWLRVFSVYGPGEDPNWFIPYIITNQLKKIDTDLTACEQQYDYLFVDDFAAMIEKVAETEGESGIYNICSGNSVSIRSVAETISQQLGSRAKLNFGVLPYRVNQSMYLGGDNDKYKNTFGNAAGIGLHQGIIRTINYYTERFVKNGGTL